MTCEEYLQLLSTTRVEELAHGRAADHLGSCAGCNRATKVVVERERNMVTGWSAMSPQVQPSDAAQVSLVAARRRTVSRWYMGGLVALMLVVGGMVATRTVFPIGHPEAGEPTVTQQFRMSCLATDAAADLLREHAASRTLTVVGRAGSDALTLRGTNEDLMRARAVFDHYDNAAASTCVLPRVGAPKPGG